MSDEASTTRRIQVKAMFTALITAFGAKDFDGFARYMRSDTVFEWPYLPLADFPDRMVGGDAFVAAARVGMADCDPYGHVVDTFYDQLDPDVLIVEYHSDTIHRPSGRRYANNYLGIVRFEEDRVVFWKEYINPLPVLEVYGSNFSNSAASTLSSSEA
jgi:uncharacterized protein